MGFRFRKSIKIAPGLRLNLSKSGISTSIGGPGATINLGSQGIRKTVGIPGSGLSFSAMSNGAKSNASNYSDVGGSQDEAQNNSKSKNGCGCLLVILAFFFALSFCGKGEDKKILSDADVNQTITDIGKGEMVFVSAKSLNARSTPSADAKRIKTLHKGQTVKVLEKQGDWLKVVQGGVVMWIAADHVTKQLSAKQSDAKPQSNSPSEPSFFVKSNANKQPRSNRQSYKEPAKYKNGRGLSSGRCPCNGGPVCVGPRGGRYCISRSGKKRYGV